MKIYFVTANTLKVKEISEFLSTLNSNLQICQVGKRIEELLCLDIDTIVKQKAIEAFRYLQHPCVVEHSGLLMDDLPGLPGGLGQIIWTAVGDRMCSFLREGDGRKATAQSFIAYCNGRHVSTFRGETSGKIALSARGTYDLNWDPIFIPDESEETYGEMGPERKSVTSPAIKAWSAFLKKEFPEIAVPSGKNERPPSPGKEAALYEGARDSKL